MRVLGPVVRPAAGLLLLLTAEFREGRFVRAQSIGDDCLRGTMSLQRLADETQGGSLVAGPGNVAFQDFALLVDRSPQVYHLTIHPNVHLVEVPLPMAKAAHA